MIAFPMIAFLSGLYCSPEKSSIYQDINLVPQEDFLVRAPPELTSTTDPHQLMINQLDFELSERLR